MSLIIGDVILGHQDPQLAVTVVGRTAGCTGICGIVCKEAAFLDNISVMWAGSQTIAPEDPWDDWYVHLPTRMVDLYGR